jgi:hypothetical protein
MSRHDDDGLDALIDRVARDMTAGEPPADLAAHVRARIGGRDAARWFVAWQPAAAAAVVVMAIAIAAVLRPERPADPPADQPAVVKTEPAAVIGGSAAANPPSVSQVQAEPGPTRSEARQVPRRGPIAPPAQAVQVAMATTIASPLPSIEPLGVAAIDDPVLIAEMSGLAMPIEIEPLQVAPLELQ